MEPGPRNTPLCCAREEPGSNRHLLERGARADADVVCHRPLEQQRLLVHDGERFGHVDLRQRHLGLEYGWSQDSDWGQLRVGYLGKGEGQGSTWLTLMLPLSGLYSRVHSFTSTDAEPAMSPTSATWL
jgi:hypothetical protein